jgi:phospholipid-binding lipoprotein MlaA
VAGFRWAENGPNRKKILSLALPMPQVLLSLLTGGGRHRQPRVDQPKQQNAGFPLLFCRTPALARFSAPVLGLAVLTACAAPAPLPLPQSDVHEAANRRVHALNQSIDKALIGPVARGASPLFNSPLGVGLNNVAGNLSMPAAILNKTLQGRFEDAVHNTWRLAINTTIGLGGLLDPASAMGLTERDTDFGATLHTWGAGEGAYLVLPVVGPTTERDALGQVVDIVIDPLGTVLKKPESTWARGIKFGSKLSDRARFGDTVDSILHESADSYAQFRLLYLQSRRFELGQEVADDAFIDPYADTDGN